MSSPLKAVRNLLNRAEHFSWLREAVEEKLQKCLGWGRISGVYAVWLREEAEKGCMGSSSQQAKHLLVGATKQL